MNKDEKTKTPTDRAAEALRLPLHVQAWLRRFTASLSTTGVLLATLFFAASLTPSLLPRTMGMQGVLSGVSLAAGYGIGVFARWLWQYMEMPLLPERAHRIGLIAAGTVCALAALLFLRRAAEWQNSVRLIMDLDPADTAHPYRVGLIAVLVFVVLLALARLFHLTYRLITRRLHFHIPRRVANVVGGAAAVFLFWTVFNGILFEWSLRAADSSFQQVDAIIEADIAQPEDPAVTGSAASLLEWEDLGRRGRAFIASGPTREEIAAFLEREAMRPVRVYVGLNSAETIEERAALALEELKRVGAFDRSTLVIMTPTGTGWVDPGAADTLEYLHAGDVASVAVQYSYLPSWLALLSESEYGVETARAVFNKIYGHWTRLPRDDRPELYLHGLSLGALNSDRAADIYDTIGDPFHGAMWSGPPFRASTWRAVTAMRRPDSPAWLPRFRDGRIVRFANQENVLDLPGERWGPMRVVFLQYASDPITFFEPQSLYRRPDWMRAPRGPDVSPDLRWYPVVTMLQLAVDMAAADTSPVGYGHVYAPWHYIGAWVAVTDPPDWTRAEIERLQAYFKERRRR
ncbi:MAG: alpha/beta-hydrolase family protein [Opitutales bacterium]|nr:alpha/beta-hydrolase family protein [Opitutales bacterium]